MSEKKIIFSGAQPSGKLTLGNYLGAIKNWTDLQEEYNCYYSVVDLHAITVPQEAKDLRANTMQLLAQYLADKNIPTWIRQVLVPGITDDEDDLNKLGMFLSQLKNVELVEVLPYHTMGIHKWENMGVEYELKGISDATWKETNRAVKILKKYGLRVR